MIIGAVIAIMWIFPQYYLCLHQGYYNTSHSPPFRVAYFHSILNDIKIARTSFYPFNREKSIDIMVGLYHSSVDVQRKISANIRNTVLILWNSKKLKYLEEFFQES